MKMLMSARFARKFFNLAVVAMFLLAHDIAILLLIPAAVPVTFPALFVLAGLVILGVLGIMPRLIKKIALSSVFLRRCDAERRARSTERIMRQADRHAHECRVNSALLGYTHAQARAQAIIDHARWFAEDLMSWRIRHRA